MYSFCVVIQLILQVVLCSVSVNWPNSCVVLYHLLLLLLCVFICVCYLLCCIVLTLPPGWQPICSPIIIIIIIIILDIIFHPVFYLKHSISEIGVCLHLQVELTQLGPIDTAKVCCSETDTTSVYWVHLSRFHLKMKTGSSLWNVVL
jgi:hypothetical protein